MSNAPHLRRPEGEPRGAVVVLQEAFGVTPWLLRQCEGLAALGYVAAAPVLFADDVTYPYDDVAGARAGLADLTIAAVLERCDEAVAEMGLPWERTAVIGYCIGGLLAFGVATRRDCAAAVTFYGGPVDKQRLTDLPAMSAAAGELRAPWLGLFGAQDHFIPVDTVHALHDSIEQTSSLVVYDADHGFACEDRPAVFDPAAAAASWGELTEWLAEHVG